MRRQVHALIVAAVGLLGAAGCGVFGAGEAAPSLEARTVEIAGGARLELRCAGSGAPTVILEHGNDADASHYNSVLPAVSRLTRVCAYNRVGVGGSSNPTAARTAKDITDDFEALLRAAEIEPPLVLVGHSVAGLTIPLYADRHPGDVAGMLFIDPAVPGMLPALADALGPPARREPADVVERRQQFAAGWPGPQYNPERHDIAASEREAAEVTTLGDIPVVVLSAERLIWEVDDPARMDRLRAAWHALHARLADLSSEGRHEVVAGSGHVIQGTNPDAVVAAIRELVERARAEDAGSH